MNTTDSCISFYRSLSSGVTLLATTSRDGRPVGLTASSVVSLSLKPPLVSANIRCGSRTFEAICETEAFGVSLLAAEQLAIARDFAGSALSQFDKYEHSVVGGVPVLTGALAWAVCDLVDTAKYGDHHLIVGQIREVEPGRRDGRPLLWHNQRFAKLAHQGSAVLAR